MVENRELVHGIDPGRVRAVVFDLGGVFLEGVLETVASFGAKIGLSGEDWAILRENLFSYGGAWEALERGEIPLSVFAAELQKLLLERGIELKLEDARDFMGTPGDDGPIRLREEIVAACRAVRAIMPTALLTNNIAEWRQDWRSRLNLGELFNHVVDSSEVGMRKPEQRIYKLMESMLGKTGEELLFIDDLGMNLKPARARGWQTVKYEDTPKVLAVLKAVAAAGAKREGRGGGE